MKNCKRCSFPGIVSGLRKNAPALVMVTTVLVLQACGGGSGGGTEPAIGVNLPANINQSSSGQTADNQAAVDQSILEAIYLNQRTPDGFYLSLPADTGSYTLSHVKNTDIVATGERSALTEHELSTDDFVQAMSWSEQKAGYLPGYQDLVDNNESEFYFEFTRVDMAEPDVMHYSRVFKQSVIDRSGVDIQLNVPLQNEVFLGTIPPSSLSPLRVRQLLEYLWAFSLSNNYGYAVLSTALEQNSAAFVYTMKEARLTQGGGGECDVITVYDIRYRVDRETGRIDKSTTTERVLSSRQDGESLSLCG